MAKQCNACGGVYDEIGPDRVPYYHVCPPVIRVPVLRDGQRQLVDLDKLRPTDSIRVLRDGQRTTVLVSAMVAGDVRLGDVPVQRRNHRDETPVPFFDGVKMTSRPRLEGAGVVDVFVAPPDPLDVFTDTATPIL